MVVRVRNVKQFVLRIRKSSDFLDRFWQLVTTRRKRPNRHRQTAKSTASIDARHLEIQKIKILKLLVLPQVGFEIKIHSDRSLHSIQKLIFEY